MNVWDPLWPPTSLLITGYELVQIESMVVVHVHIIDQANWQPFVYIAFRLNILYKHKLKFFFYVPVYIIDLITMPTIQYYNDTAFFIYYRQRYTPSANSISQSKT